MPATKLIPAEDTDCIELIRVSTPDQARIEKGGIDAQYASCKKIAGQHPITARWQIRIDGVSGAAVQRSPGFQHLLRIVESGECRGIIMKDASRLMRPDNFADYQILELLRTHKVRLYTDSGVTDFDSNNDRFMATVMLGVNGLERGVIRERTMGGTQAKRSRGEFVAGRASIPSGLAIELVGRVRRYAVDPDKIKQVVRLFELFTGGCLSFTELAARTGIPYDSIKNILTNEIYTGERVIKETVDPRKNQYRADGTLQFQRRVKLPVEEQERIPVFDNPPISKAMFLLAQRMLAHKSRQGPAAPQDDDPLYYRGCLVCGQCGRNLFALTTVDPRPGRGQQYTFYICEGKKGVRGRWDPERRIFDRAIAAGTCDTVRIPSEKLHPVLDQIMVERLGSREFLRDAIEQRLAKVVGGVDKKEGVIAEIVQLKKRQDTLLDRHLDGSIPEGTFKTKNDVFKTQLAELYRQLQALNDDVTAELDADLWVPLAFGFAGWEFLSPSEKKLSLARVLPRFKITGSPGLKRGDTQVSIQSVSFSLGNLCGAPIVLSLD